MSEPRREILAEGIEIWLGDCRDVLPLIGRVDAVVTDPPYGLGDKWQGGEKKWPLHHVDGMAWDAMPFKDIKMIVSAGTDAIIWGGHLYDLPPARGWLIWDKIVRNFTSGHVEMAWSTIDQPTRAFSYAHGQLATEGKFHPTQKPLPLMKWCLEQMPRAETILDPFMGSGTTGAAAAKMGRKFIGIEANGRYFDVARRRIAEALRQPDMFVPRPAPAKQEAFTFAETPKEQDGKTGILTSILTNPRQEIEIEPETHMVRTAGVEPARIAPRDFKTTRNR